MPDNLTCPVCGKDLSVPRPSASMFASMAELRRTKALLLDRHFRESPSCKNVQNVLDETSEYSDSQRLDELNCIDDYNRYEENQIAEDEYFDDLFFGPEE